MAFDAEQAIGSPPRPLRKPGHDWERSERVEKRIENCGAALEHNHQDRVYYDPGEGLVRNAASRTVPRLCQFYPSALHELGHWTGYPVRMNRESLMEGIRQSPKSR